MKNIFIFLPFAIWLSVFTTNANSAELTCNYVYDIQERFLNLHINFSNLDKKKLSFQPRMFQLERRVEEQFIKSLDSEKIYFTSQDVKKIKRWMRGIFAQTKQLNCSVLDNIYNLYAQRVKERVEFAKDYLKKDFIIDSTAQLVLDSRKRKRPKNTKAMNKFHEKYIQYQMANSIIASDEEEYKDQLKEAKENILRVYDRIQQQTKNWTVHLTPEEKKHCYKRKKSSGQVTICKPYKWYAIYLNSFARALDPHSSYLSQEDYEDFEINMRLSLDGIGAHLSSRHGHTVIENLTSGGAAARSGQLQIKDKILAVGQSRQKMVNIFNMDLRDVVSMIRGKRGTPVYLKILRSKKKKRGDTSSNLVKKVSIKQKKTTKPSRKKIFTIRLVRSRVNLQDQAASMFYFDREVHGKKYKIGVLFVPSFYGEGGVRGRSVTKDIKKLLIEANKKKVSALVLDLSNNGGGSLPEAVRVAGLFFAKGGVVRQLVKTRSGDRYLTLSDIDKNVEYSGPLTILVNRVSASASEIVSGTLKSYKRAVVVGGDHTFGKGSIQSVERLNFGLGSIRVTVGLFFIPNGFSTQLKGVSSDIRFPSVFSNNEIGEKTLDYVLDKKKIPSFISQSAYVFEGKNKWTTIEDDLVAFLRKRSAGRIKKNKKFHKINKEIQEISLKRKRGYVTTIAQIFDEARKEEAEAEEDKSDLESLQTSKDINAMKKKKYMERPDIQEAVNIATDHIQWQSRSQLTSSKKNN